VKLSNKRNTFVTGLLLATS